LLPAPRLYQRIGVLKLATQVMNDKGAIANIPEGQPDAFQVVSLATEIPSRSFTAS